MFKRILCLFLILALLESNHRPTSASEPASPKTVTFNQFISDLPEWDLPALFWWEIPFKSSALSKAGVRLQALPKEQRERWLRLLAGTRKKSNWAILLCRMLYEGKGGKPLRPPMIGIPHYIGSIDAADVPLTPIVIFEGVPFLVMNGVSLAGAPEGARSYVDYTLANGVAIQYKYLEKSSYTYASIADAFFVSLLGKKVRMHLDDACFLRRQVAP